MTGDVNAIPAEAIEAATQAICQLADTGLDDALADAALTAAAPLLRAPLEAEIERLREDGAHRTDAHAAEIERLQGTIDRQLGDCTGCTTEPEETCPIDGRTYADWVRIASEVIGLLNEEREKVDRLCAENDTLRATVEALHPPIEHGCRRERETWVGIRNGQQYSEWSCPTRDAALSLPGLLVDPSGGKE